MGSFRMTYLFCAVFLITTWSAPYVQASTNGKHCETCLSYQSLPGTTGYVLFYRNFGRFDITVEKDPDATAWRMYLRDHKSIVGDFREVLWGGLRTLASQKYVLKMIDVSLSEFQAEYPSVHISGLEIEPHVIRELWHDILSAVRAKLVGRPGIKRADQSLLDNPPNDYLLVPDAISLAVLHSQTKRLINLLFERHGIAFVKCYAENDDVPFFSSVCDGHKWSEIAKWPGLGIGYPMLVDFEIKMPASH